MSSIWTTRDGDVYRVTEMETEHLKNTITFLHRRTLEIEHLVGVYDPPPILQEMIEELRKRMPAPSFGSRIKRAVKEALESF